MVARPGIVQAAGTGRDKPVPYKPDPRPCVNSRRDLVGATLAVARPSATHIPANGTGQARPLQRPRRLKLDQIEGCSRIADELHVAGLLVRRGLVLDVRVKAKEHVILGAAELDLLYLPLHIF